MGVNKFCECHRPGSKFLMITLVLYFLFFVSITPFAFGLAEDINIELEMSESLEDMQELTEEFLKSHCSDIQYPLKPVSTFEDMDEKFINSYIEDIPFPPPKTI